MRARDQTALINKMVTALVLAQPVCEDALFDAQSAIDNPPPDLDPRDLPVLHYNRDAAKAAFEAIQAALADATQGA